MPTYEPILLKNMQQPGYKGSLAEYERAGGYQALRKVLGKVSPADVTAVVMKSGLRGRGGAGFPTGVKWGFLPKDYQGPRYLCCNADESEPGTFKDRQLIERDPHQLIEGMLIACYAIGAACSYIYIRGEFVLGARILEQAIKDARAAGYVGKNILGTGTTIDSLTIYFRRPNPDACFSTSQSPTACAANAAPVYDYAYVQVKASGGSDYRTVKISNTGQIAVCKPNLDSAGIAAC